MPVFQPSHRHPVTQRATHREARPPTEDFVIHRRRVDSSYLGDSIERVSVIKKEKRYKELPAHERLYQ